MTDSLTKAKRETAEVLRRTVKEGIVSLDMSEGVTRKATDQSEQAREREG